MNYNKIAREFAVYGIAVVVIGALFWTLMKLFSGPLPDTNKEILNLITGFLIAKGGTIVDYYFGSSKGSAEKSEVLSALDISKKQQKEND